MSPDQLLPEYRLILSRLLDRGRDLCAVIKRAQRPGGPEIELDTLSQALEHTTRALLDNIRLDHALARERRPDTRLVARMVETICRRLEAAAALLPGVPIAPPHQDIASLRAQARHLAAPPDRRGPVPSRRQANRER